MKTDLTVDSVVSDGAERYQAANTEEFDERRKLIKQEFETRYVERLRGTNPLKRWRLRAKLRQEILEATDLSENYYLNTPS